MRYAILRWLSLAGFVGALALMGDRRLHLSHFNRFFAILLALSVLIMLIFVWTSEEPPPGER
ncbi:MAG TPA: hypothetical protein VNP04_25270 [Alphaproteobacteria bacterium]|nr:hypothetical protein [Alphaproteobacteria bacterium]